MLSSSPLFGPVGPFLPLLFAAGLALLGFAWARMTLLLARMLQIEEYEWRRLVLWSIHSRWFLSVPALAGALVTVAGVFLMWNGLLVHGALLAVPLLVGDVVLLVLFHPLPAKKALVYTPRMRRLLAAAAGIGLMLLAVVFFLEYQHGHLEEQGYLLAVPVLLSPLAAVLILLTALALTEPLERYYRRGFILRAGRRLEQIGCRVVAVAGSYGKTSTKGMVAHVLELLGPAYPTPHSFNTLLGVTRAINETLPEGTRTFVVEMDAYRGGEISRICSLVKPEMAVVTAVGPQHLERFGSMEAVVGSLAETTALLPKDGVAVVYGGEEPSSDSDPAFFKWQRELVERAGAGGVRLVVYGSERTPGAVARAENVRLSPRGTAFRFRWRAEGLDVPVETPLLGRHQAENGCAALVVAHLLGVDVGQAAHRLSTMKQVEHRLQVLPGATGVTVIDDSYNANPVGVHNGLEVLEQFGSGQKILVTPGIVELGEREEEENRKYGAHAARVCDHLILVRSRAAMAMGRGIDQEESKAVTHLVGSLSEAQDIIRTVTRAGDVIMFANDLPDTYMGIH